MQQPGGKGPQNDHLRLVPAGNIGEKCSVGGFYLVRTAHPTAGGAVLRGFAAYQHADFARMGCPAAVRLVPQHFEERRVGSSLLPFGDGVWWAGGGRQGRVRAVVPADQSLAGGSAPFSTRFASKAADGVFARNRGAGRGGRPPPSRRPRPDPVAPSRQPIIPWKNGGPAFTMTAFPPCFVSAPPLCRKASLPT